MTPRGDEPHEIHGMAAMESWQSGAGFLIRQRIVQTARFALANLTDAEFQMLVTDAIRDRPWPVSQNILTQVQK
jgi:hypothetical protein